MRAPRDRRHRYPFVNCTDCGPRATIIEDLPYDLIRTTMHRFPLCPRWDAEYSDPADRRFHAEPVACPVCGPQLAWDDLRARGGSPGGRQDRRGGRDRRAERYRRLSTRLRRGRCGAVWASRGGS
ncbi:hypothetical protein [Streptomyces sp. NPDC048419]|uniref:hypothetical protein n=1 Tax=Streptomyces sp. NPDC048419 TaxID=3365547 RepID=UPI00371845FB